MPSDICVLCSSHSFRYRYFLFSYTYTNVWTRNNVNKLHCHFRYSPAEMIATRANFRQAAFWRTYNRLRCYRSLPLFRSRWHHCADFCLSLFRIGWARFGRPDRFPGSRIAECTERGKKRNEKPEKKIDWTYVPTRANAQLLLTVATSFSLVTRPHYANTSRFHFSVFPFSSSTRYYRVVHRRQSSVLRFIRIL